MKKLVQSLLVLLLSGALPGQQAPIIEVFAANPSTCPVLILGLGLYDDGDLLSRVVLGNSSTKPITSVQLGWRLAGPGGVLLQGSGFGPVMAFDFPAGKVVVAGTQGALQNEIQDYFERSSQLPGSLLVSIVAVTYSDGTEWRRDRRETWKATQQGGLGQFLEQLDALRPPFHLVHPGVKR